MLSIFIIFLSISLFVCCAAYAIYHMSKIGQILTTHIARKIEFIGYILLIILLIWEFVIKDLVFYENFDPKWYILEQQLDTMFIMIKQSSGRYNPNSEKLYEYFRTCGNATSYVTTQLRIIKGIEALLQISSTVCIAIGRLQDLQFKEKSPQGIVTPEHSSEKDK